MPPLHDELAERVRARVRRDGVTLDPQAAAAYVGEEVRRYSEHALGDVDATLPDEAGTRRDVLAQITGFGALQPLLDDPEIEEIWINAPDTIFVARGGVKANAPIELTSDTVRDLVERMLATTGRRLDLSSPFVDASLPDGSRLHVVIPEVTARHWAINIRKFVPRVRTLNSLVREGALTRHAGEFLRMSMIAGANILVSGATHTGKTTLIGALLGAGPAHSRVVTVEETFELAPAIDDWVALQCRQPSLEGSGEITLRHLVRESLRMRPDRIALGEVRGAEAFDLLIALNSGVPGISSIHANGAQDALAKLSTLALLAGGNVDIPFVTSTVAAVVDVVVHCTIDRSGHRSVDEIVALTGSGREVESLFRRDRGQLEATGVAPTRTSKFDSAGLDIRALLEHR
ncbi:pilus assembly protein CpaF [Microbacteriaceae bacterium SG_E_30_P1]|uniref:Pilus assembly protein CpaF n=1 Tax=Antiquaquibacter oligotrophicus TaxID=2880260 RepID=A0ABT6KKG8_9MICO|nr:ATPase, T2SS/T4P/T4SS family [Antiquaquibacter oligotrophicus]MDH6180470.1 pilus assembly protein CpaF [Antiquaquibacter oligotrophicus]UDF13792.1 Flp pilus assembly complex ATPase component TadA [Antiquaquibacter oligotrophicus]